MYDIVIVISLHLTFSILYLLQSVPGFPIHPTCSIWWPLSPHQSRLHHLFCSLNELPLHTSPLSDCLFTLCRTFQHLHLGRFLGFNPACSWPVLLIFVLVSWPTFHALGRCTCSFPVCLPSAWMSSQEEPDWPWFWIFPSPSVYAFGSCLIHFGTCNTCGKQQSSSPHFPINVVQSPLRGGYILTAPITSHMHDFLLLFHQQHPPPI